MNIQLIRSLTFEGEVLGLRFVTTSGLYDVDAETLKHYGVVNIDLATKAELKVVGDLYKTDEEIAGNFTANELVKGSRDMEDIVAELKNDVVTRSMFDPDFLSPIPNISLDNVPDDKIVWEQVSSIELPDTDTGFKPPYKMSLDDFLLDSRWKAVKIRRNDEYDSQYEMIQPDHKKWSGGWIGAYPTDEEAKRGFHYMQVKYAINNGRDVDPEAYKTYDDLRQYVDEIALIELKLSLIDSDVLEVELDKGTTYARFPLTSFPLKRRSDQRFFIVDNDLIPTDLKNIRFTSNFLDAREIVAIALSRFINKYLLKTNHLKG